MGGSGRYIIVIGILLGLGFGFILANLTYRIKAEAPVRDIDNLSLSSRASSSVTDNPPNIADEKVKVEEGEFLTETELKRAIVYADNNKSDLKLQQELGLALFQYSLSKKDSALIPASIRLLERARNNPDKNPLINQSIGDGWFILAREKNSNDFKRARAAYQNALKNNPNNPDLLTGIGQTYFYQTKPDIVLAISYYQKALKINFEHEKSLECLAIALIVSEKLKEAENTLDDLRKLNSDNPSINSLQLNLARKKAALKK